MSKGRVAIIGAGVSGLTCGIVLQERGYDVELFAETVTMQTTAALASAIWFPYHVGDEADADAKAAVYAWADKSYQRFQSLLTELNCGVSMIDFHVVSRNYIPLPEWKVPPSRPLSDVMPPYRSGYVVNVPVMETPLYLPYLMRKVKSQLKIGRIDKVPDDFKVIVNCCGIDGPRLSNSDSSPMRPGRGVIVRGKSAQSYAFLDADGEKEGTLTYLVPRRQFGDCVLGGSDNPKPDWSLVPTNGEVEAILDRCRKIAPDLQTGEPRVGLRPIRAKGVRLESETIDGRTVIHNYGHGGAGLTLSWGCAEDVADLVEKAFAH